MRGKIFGRAKSPNEIEYSLTITLTISDWKELNSQIQKSNLSSSYPAWQVVDGINDLINNAEQSFSSEIEVK